MSKSSRNKGFYVDAKMEVLSYFGNGFREVIGQGAFLGEMQLGTLAHLREVEVEMDVRYKDILLGGDG